MNSRRSPPAFSCFARFSPPSLEGHRARPRLLQMLDGIPAQVLSAPAGFGKTVLLAEYARRWFGRVRWLGLSGVEQTLASSLALFVLAWADGAELHDYPRLQQARDGLYEDPFGVFEQLALYLSQYEEPTLLVLDAADSLKDARLLTALRHFVSLLPPSIHCCISLRDDTSWGWHALYLERQVGRLGLQDLRWSDEDFAAAGSVLPEDVRHWLGGWPAAVALWMRNPEHWDTTTTRSSLLDYCLQERIRPLSEAARRLLWHKAPTENCSWTGVQRMLGESAASAVAELQDAQLLERDTRTGIDQLVFPALIRDAVVRHLERNEPETLRRIHIDAARDWRDRGQIIPALDFATRAGDPVLAAELLGENGWDLYLNGHIGLVRRALLLLESIVDILAPELLLLYMKVHLLVGESVWRPRTVPEWQALLGRVADGPAQHFDAQNRLRFEAGFACIQAQRALTVADPEAARTAMEQVQLSLVPAPLRAAASGVLAELAVYDGQLDLAAEDWQHALQAAQGRGYKQEVLWYTHQLAETESARGHCHRAHILRAGAVQLAEQQGLLRNFAFWCLLRGHVELLLQTLKEEEAALWLKRGLSWFETPEARLPFDILRAALASQRQETAAWNEAMAALTRVDAGSLHPYQRVRLEGLLVDYWSGRAEKERLKLWLDFLPPLSENCHHLLNQYDGRNRLRALAFLGRWDEWRTIHDRLRRGSQALPMDRALLESLAWEFEQGPAGAWVETLAQGHHMALLRRLACRHPQRWRELAAHQGPGVPTALQMASLSRTGPSLTARERQLLQLLDDGVDNEQLADRLCLALGTVKNSLSLLYRKIGVSNRTQAGIWWRNHLKEEQAGTHNDRSHAQLVTRA